MFLGNSLFDNVALRTQPALVGLDVADYGHVASVLWSANSNQLSGYECPCNERTSGRRARARLPVPRLSRPPACRSKLGESAGGRCGRYRGRRMLLAQACLGPKTIGSTQRCRLEPPSPAVPAAPDDNNRHDDDDKKCRVVHSGSSQTPPGVMSACKGRQGPRGLGVYNREI